MYNVPIVKHYKYEMFHYILNQLKVTKNTKILRLIQNQVLLKQCLNFESILTAHFKTMKLNLRID